MIKYIITLIKWDILNKDKNRKNYIYQKNNYEEEYLYSNHS